MNICIIYVLYGGLTMGTPACQTQLFHGDGVITPHEVIYASHVSACTAGYLYHVPHARVNFHGPRIRVKRYHDIRKRYNQRVRHYRHKKFSERKRFKYHKHARSARRTHKHYH